LPCSAAAELRESGGDALAVSEEAIRAGTLELARAARPPRDAEVIVFNTGRGSSYRF